jgi:CO dehydrogenase/acetyl-CoA synthase beta subunit
MSFDMAPLVASVREFLAERRDKTTTFSTPFDGDTLSRQFGYVGKNKGKANIILSEQVAAELGHPSTASLPIILVTFQKGIVRGGRISIVGPDIDQVEKGHPCPFAQIVMLAVRPGGKMPDPFEIENTQFLTNRLPGYMVRSVPGKMWVRVSEKARAQGLTLKTVGSALTAAYTGDFKDVRDVEVVFVTSSKSDVEALARVAAKAEILAGRHKKLAVAGDGEIECEGLDCESCDEKPVCDSLRDIVRIRRRRKGGASSCGT